MHTQGSAQHKDHTLHHHFTLSSKRRLNVTLANISGQSYWVWSFIQQTFIITSLCQAPHRKTCPFPSRRSWTCGWRELATTKLGDNRDSHHSPQGSPELGYVTRSSGVRASHTHVDPEDELESGLEARVEGRWAPQRWKVRGDKVGSEKCSPDI